MRFAHLFPPATSDDTDETCQVNGSTVTLKNVPFENIPELPTGDAKWVDGGSAILFSTPSRVFGIIKVCVVSTKGLKREEIATHTYLASVTADGESYICRGEALENANDAITAVLNQTVKKSELGTPDTTPELLLDPLRTLCEHTVENGIHDGSTRFTNPFLQSRVKSATAIAKTSGLLTSRSRPLSLALLNHAPQGCWRAQVADVTLARLHDRASHVFLVEAATPEQLALLRAWSDDMAFPGYPYPLMLADQLARVTNNERDAWKVVLASDTQAAKVLTGEMKASDAHAMLEHILYGKEF